MKILALLNQGEPATLWNGFRLANLLLEEMDDVTICLNGPSVRYQELDSIQFPLQELARVFTLSEGVLLA